MADVVVLSFHVIMRVVCLCVFACVCDERPIKPSKRLFFVRVYRGIAGDEKLFSDDANDQRDRERVVLDLLSNIQWCKIQTVTFGEPLLHVRKLFFFLSLSTFSSASSQSHASVCTFKTSP